MLMYMCSILSAELQYGAGKIFGHGHRSHLHWIPSRVFEVQAELDGIVASAKGSGQERGKPEP